MSYFITGATGTLGQEVVKSLTSSGYNVIAGSRNPKFGSESNNHNLKKVHFNYEDESTFQNAKNVDGVFLMEPPALDPNQSDLAVPFFNFLQKNKVPRLIYLSSNGMENLDEVPFHKRMEQRITKSNLNWHIVRPSFYAQSFNVYEKENIEQRNIIFLPAGKGKTAYDSTLDIGEAIAKILTEDTFRTNEISTLTGEKNYDHFEVAEMLTEILNRKIINVDPDAEDYRRILQENNVPNIVADYTIPLYGLIKENKVKQITDTLKNIIQRKPESLKEVLKRDFLKD